MMDFTLWLTQSSQMVCLVMVYFCFHLMMGLHKFSLKTFFTALAGLAFCCTLTISIQATNIHPANVGNILTTDTIPLKPDTTGYTSRKAVFKKDSTSVRDSQRKIDDTLPRQRIDTFSLKISKDTLDAPVVYEAEDSAVVLALEKKIILYGKTKTVYKDVTLTAPKVELDQQTNLLTAYNSRDSLGEVITRARFEQGENRFESDTIQYNFKSQKGLTRNTFTQQSEMFIQGELIKKVNASTVFVKRGRFTTCDLDEPHFAFRANKLKIINNKVAVSGPMHPEFEDVPIPIYLPFGFYPLSRGRHSGFLPPQFTSTENYGLGLEGLGYYKVLNDNFDLTVRGNIYSYGGWMVNVIPTYRVRYRYNGALSIHYQFIKTNFRGDPDFEKIKMVQIGWNHSVDQRARPGVSFNANVNAGSTRYNRYQTYDQRANNTNQLSSSISYSKTWKDKPFNLQLSATHSQNANTRAVDITLPDGSFSVTTIYPFEKKIKVGPAKWYEKIGVGYNGTFRNMVAFYDSAFSINRLLDTLRWGIGHSVPLSVSLPPLGPLIVSPSISYTEQWMMQKRFLTWNPQLKKIDTVNKKGLFTARDMGFSIGMNTALFGIYQFRNSRVIAIRHTLRPNIALNYKPNLGKKYFQRVQVDTANHVQVVNMYSGNLYQGYSNQEFGGMSFGIDNVLEMKMRSKKDTANPVKKVRLIDALGVTSNYNFLADSFKLGDFSMHMSSVLFDKLSISVSANLSPYKVDNTGREVNSFVWEDRFSAGRLNYASISMGTQFKSKPRDASKKSQVKPVNPNLANDPALMGDQQRLLEYMQRNPSEFVDFNIPYDFSVQFALNLTRAFQPVTGSFKSLLNSSINFTNSFSLTPKWNFSTNGYFDVQTKKLGSFSMAINREMHCWQMSIGVTPVGYQRYFNISISPKSSLLQNLKVNRTRVFNDF
jgi:LPS-assembly protein